MKLKPLISLIFFIFTAFSCEWRDLETCERNQPACGVEDPLQHLHWLREQVASLESHKTTNAYPYLFITQAELNGETVFVMDNCCWFCDTMILAYNCKGEVVLQLQNRDEVKNAKIIWKPEGFQCSI